jgi:hypothetical protein
MLLTALGCSKGTPGMTHVPGTIPTDDVVRAWDRANLSPQPFAAADASAYYAGACAQGQVKGVSALICEYNDDDGINRGKKTILDRWSKERVQTGITVRQQRTLVALVDQQKADPNGKTIDKMVTAFQKLGK